MNRAATIAALSATAADLLNQARVMEEAVEPLGKPIDPLDAEQLAWADETRVSAGACVAAINHLNGVSPE